jgi:hypothetical protein
MTKELLSAWGVDFEPVNVEGNDDAIREMVALGAPLVPAVAYGGKIVHGWNPAGFGKLLGVPFSDVPRLGPRELARRLDRILELTQAALRRAAPAHLPLEGPGRKRSLRQLAYHTFRLSAAFVDAMEQDGLEEAWLQQEAPANLQSAGQIAEYGDAARRRLAAWFAQAHEPVFAQPVATYYGEQSVHALLERTAWHAGQHMRQVHDLLERAAALPANSFDSAVFRDLPMPKAVW